MQSEKKPVGVEETNEQELTNNELDQASGGAPSGTQFPGSTAAGMRVAEIHRQTGDELPLL